MQKRLWLFFVILSLVVATGFFLTGLQPRTPLTGQMRKDLGAAAYVPASVSSYSSALDLRRQWEQVWNSNAVQRLVKLPFVQQTWAKVQHERVYGEIMRGFRTNPVLLDLVPILKDAASNEIFFCTGPRLPELMEAYGELWGTFQFGRLGALLQGGLGETRSPFPDIAPLIELVLENRDKLRMPGVLLGFKLTDPQAAADFLDRWVPLIEHTPVGTITRKTIRGATFHIFELSAEEIPDDAMESLSSGLMMKGVKEGDVKALVKWLRSQRLVVGAGVLDGYLMLSLGKDTSLPGRWGRGRCLARSREFEPLRQRYRPGLLGITYCSAELAKTQAFTPEDFEELSDALLDEIPDDGPSAALRGRLEEDLEDLTNDLEEVFTEPASTLSFSFRNRGIETYGVGAAASGLDGSRPLSILAHRGPHPMACLARRAASDPDAYDKLAKWLKIAHGYLEDYAVPEMEPTARAEYRKVMKLARPFLASIDETTRQYLIPAIDGTQSMVVVDGRGVLARLPDGEPLPAPVPIPRFGLAIELNDAEKFRQAIQRYAGAIRKLLAEIHTLSPRVPPGLELPDPKTAEVAGGTLYYYRLPWPLGRDVLPCALLKGRILVLASSPGLAEEMAEAREMPTCDITHTERSAGAVSLADCSECWDMLRRITGAVLTIIDKKSDQGPKQQMMTQMIKVHADALWGSLGAIRTYRSTTRTENGRSIHHSWLHVEDISP